MSVFEAIDSKILEEIVQLGLGDISHAILMRISSVKPVKPIIADKSHSIMNAILHGLSANYGSVY